MTESSFIRRRQPDQAGLDFDGLRREGLKIVQEISGDIWTDYNVHDPGVTLLEALCYALTDLAYRAGFEAEDYLTLSDGSIDFEKLALYRPDEILPSYPLTDMDYRKLLLNSVPNIDNIWVRNDASEGRAGICNIYVQLGEQVKDQDNEGVRKAYADLISKAYASNRNLCEDLGRVEIVERIPYVLRGEIEISGKRDPASILAEIYFACTQYLSPKVPIHSFSEMYKKGWTHEELLSGVLTGHGYISDDDLHPWRGHFSIPDLTGLIARIDGVRNINRLIFVDREGCETDSIDLGSEHSYHSVACLHFPSPDEEGELKLYKGGKLYPVLQRDIDPELSRLGYSHQVLRQRKRRYDWVGSALPSGTSREFSEYYSLQNHLPAVYGLNAYGVPDSASPERKAQAAQLKAYLLLFEQVMANFLQNIQEIPNLFSLDEQLDRSYFYQVLHNDAVPDVEKIYMKQPGDMDSALGDLMRALDNYGDRRNRVLDYLLAVYGERFSQNSLRHFFHAASNSDEERIANKIEFVRDIANISKNRSAAYNYRKPADGLQNVSGLKRKIELLLGLKRSLSTAEGDEDWRLFLVEHILLRPSSDAEGSWHDVPDDFYSFKISIVFSGSTPSFSSIEFRKLAEETIFLNCPAHIHPEIFWLDEMERFEALHGTWLEAKRLATRNADEASIALIRYLLEIREQGA